MSDEKFWEELQKKNEILAVHFSTKEELAQKKRQLDENDQLAEKYPDRDGSEFATLHENRNIFVHYHYHGHDGSYKSGFCTYSPDDTDYQVIWERHSMKDRKGQIHFIMKKWDVEKEEWTDLGDGWLG